MKNNNGSNSLSLILFLILFFSLFFHNTLLRSKENLCNIHLETCSYVKKAQLIIEPLDSLMTIIIELKDIVDEFIQIYVFIPNKIKTDKISIDSTIQYAEIKNIDKYTLLWLLIPRSKSIVKIKTKLELPNVEMIKLNFASNIINETLNWYLNNKNLLCNFDSIIFKFPPKTSRIEPFPKKTSKHNGSTVVYNNVGLSSDNNHIRVEWMGGGKFPKLFLLFIGFFPTFGTLILIKETRHFIRFILLSFFFILFLFSLYKYYSREWVGDNLYIFLGSQIGIISILIISLTIKRFKYKKSG